MRNLLFALWLVVPALLLAWHFGPGQRLLFEDRAASARAVAEAAAADGRWEAAAQAADEALGWLAKAAAAAQDATTGESAATPGSPTPQVAALTVLRARAQARSGELLEGMAQLQDLIEKIEEVPALARIRDEARHELATVSYHAAWLMRLEGAASDEWQVAAEEARQGFRLLAETAATPTGTKSSANAPNLGEAAARNLEATIRLQRMDLSELQGLPLPKNCSCNGKNLSQRCRAQRLSRKKGSSKSNTPDVREQVKQDTNNAGKNSRAEGEAW